MSKSHRRRKIERFNTEMVGWERFKRFIIGVIVLKQVCHDTNAPRNAMQTCTLLLFAYSAFFLAATASALFVAPQKSSTCNTSVPLSRIATPKPSSCTGSPVSCSISRPKKTPRALANCSPGNRKSRASAQYLHRSEEASDRAAKVEHERHERELTGVALFEVGKDLIHEHTTTMRVNHIALNDGIAVHSMHSHYYLRDASDDADWDAGRGERPLVLGRR